MGRGVKAILAVLALACTAANLAIIHHAGGWTTLGACLTCGALGHIFSSAMKRVR